MDNANWLLAVLALSVLLAGCDQSRPNAKDSDPARGEYNYGYDKKDVYVADASNDLVALNQKINELADQAAAASEAFRSNAQPRIQELRQRRAAVNQKLEVLKKATEADWNEAKNDYMKSYNELKTSCQQVWQWLTGKLGP